MKMAIFHSFLWLSNIPVQEESAPDTSSSQHHASSSSWVLRASPGTDPSHTECCTASATGAGCRVSTHQSLTPEFTSPCTAWTQAPCAAWSSKRSPLAMWGRRPWRSTKLSKVGPPSEPLPLFLRRGRHWAHNTPESEGNYLSACQRQCVK